MSDPRMYKVAKTELTTHPTSKAVKLEPSMAHLSSWGSSSVTKSPKVSTRPDVKYDFGIAVDNIVDRNAAPRDQRHMRRKRTEKSVVACTQCGLQFASVGNMNRHVRVSHQGKRVYCNYNGCSQSFSQMADLTRHLRRVHHVDSGSGKGATASRGNRRT